MAIGEFSVQYLARASVIWEGQAALVVGVAAEVVVALGADSRRASAAVLLAIHSQITSDVELIFCGN